MYKFITLFLIPLAFVFHAKGQTILSELALSNHKISNIQSFDAGDKILFTYDEKDLGSHHIKRCHHIYLDGRVKQIQTNLTANDVLCGALTFGKEEYVYYFVDKGKDIALKALRYNDSTNTVTTFNSDIVLRGTLLATWADDNLHLILYDKDANQIEVLELNKFNLVSQKKIAAPVDIGRYYKYMSHIAYNATISIAQGSSPAKLYQNEGYLYITIDKTSYELNNRTPETLIIKFDLVNERSSIQRISYSGGKRFSSFLFRDKIYRVSVSNKSYDLKTFDLTEKKLSDAIQISKNSIHKDSLIYLRDGKAVSVSKKETLSRMMKVSDLCLPSIVVYAENDSITTIISGNYYNQKGMGSFVGVGTLESFLTFIITSAIKQMAEPPGISRYTYMKKPVTGSGNVSLRQRIDDYEISLEAKRLIFDYKGYLDFADGVLAIYHSARNNKLTLVLFRRDQNSGSK